MVPASAARPSWSLVQSVALPRARSWAAITATLLGAAAALLAVTVARVWPFTVDDAFITLRYARNLATGAGLTWNADAAPVEGYTGLLWTVLMAVPHLAVWDAVLFGKVLGVAATVGYLVLAYGLVLRLADGASSGARHLGAAATTLVLAAAPATAVHAIAGLETAAYTLTVTAFCVGALRARADPTTGRLVAAALLALAVGLTRPDGNLVAVIGLAAAFAGVPGHRWALARWALLLYVVPGLVYFAWRWASYGLPLPLPFYVKVASGGGLKGLGPTLDYLGGFVAPLLPLGLLAARRAPGRALLPGLIAAGQIVFYLFPEHIMTYEWRFVFPTAPLVAALAGAGLAGLIDRPRLRGAAGLALVLGVCVAFVSFLQSDAGAVIAERQGYAAALGRAHVALGQDLATIPHDAGGPVLAIGDAGAVPYYAGWRTIDTFGLNDAAIATSNRRGLAAYVLAQRPDLLVLISRQPDALVSPLPWENDLYRAGVAEGLERLAVLRSDDGYYLWVLADPSGAQFLAIRGALPPLRATD